MIDTGFLLVLFLTSSCSPSLSGITLHLRIPHQSCVEIYLLELHPPSYPCSDLPGYLYAQRLCENGLGEDKGSLGVPTPVRNNLPFHSHYICKPALCYSKRCGVQACQLRNQQVPTTMINSIVQDYSVQVQHVVVMQEVSVDSMQQQVGTLWDNVRPVRVFLRGGTPPPLRQFLQVPPSGHKWHLPVLHYHKIMVI